MCNLPLPLDELKSLMALETKDLQSLSIEQLCDRNLPRNILHYGGVQQVTDFAHDRQPGIH